MEISVHATPRIMNQLDVARLRHPRLSHWRHGKNPLRERMHDDAFNRARVLDVRVLLRIEAPPHETDDWHMQLGAMDIETNEHVPKANARVRTDLVSGSPRCIREELFEVVRLHRE